MKIKPISHNLCLAALCCALLWATALTAHAGWAPPESSVTPPAVVTLDAFTAPYWNGAYPNAALVVGPDGALYGSTVQGGTNRYYGDDDGYGTLFRLATSGIFSKLHDFNGTDGAFPTAALVVGPDGMLYGSTWGSWEMGFYGTLFRVETNGTFTSLHGFNGTDGDGPSAALVVGPDGALYGSSPEGGTGGWAGYGTLFRLETNGTFTKLHDFERTGAAGPSALVVGADGALYGSTFYGGTNFNPYGNGHGTLFRLGTNGTFTKLHDFNGTDGAYPLDGLVAGPDGALYGAASGGGTGGFGTLFRLATNGTFKKLHDFNGTDGAYPRDGLVAGPDGALYGAASGGGTGGFGTLFRLATNGTFTKLHDFNGTDGSRQSWSSGPLVAGPHGALYGSTYSGGISNNGTLFRLGTDGACTKLNDFNGANGAHPSAALVKGLDGALYGSTPYGGSQGGSRRGGTLFKLVLNRPPVADASATPALVVSPKGTNATVALDGSRSSDPDGDLMQYLWFLALNAQPSTLLATGVVSAVVLPVEHP